MKFLLALLILSIFFVSGCSDKNDNEINQKGFLNRSGSVQTFCSDGIVCYYLADGGGSCFKDKELTEKYCGKVLE